MATPKLNARQKKAIVPYANKHGTKRAAKHFKVRENVVYYYLAKARREALAAEDTAPLLTVVDDARTGRAMAREWDNMKQGIATLGPPKVDAVASKHEAVLDAITMLRRAIKLRPAGEMSVSDSYVRLALARLTGEEP
jgi:hypothetical protein